MANRSIAIALASILVRVLKAAPGRLARLALFMGTYIGAMAIAHEFTYMDTPGFPEFFPELLSIFNGWSQVFDRFIIGGLVSLAGGGKGLEFFGFLVGLGGGFLVAVLSYLLYGVIALMAALIRNRFVFLVLYGLFIILLVIDIIGYTYQ